MRKLYFLAGALALLALPLFADSRWGPGGCAPAPAMSPVGGALEQFVQQPRHVYAWRLRPDQPEQAYLYLDGRQIGGWDARTQKYRRLIDWNRDLWGPEEDVAPIAPPPDLVRAGPPIGKLQAFQLNGVKSEELCKHKRHTVNGRLVAEEAAVGALLDDSKKLFLSVWARDPAKREAVVNDMKKDATLWAWVQERCHLYAGEAASPDHFLTKDREGKPLYAIDGEPTICLQDPQGVELWHDAGYTQGPKALEGLRKRDPNYRPDDTPGPNTRTPASDMTLLVLLGLAGAGLALLFLPQKEPQSP